MRQFYNTGNPLVNLLNGFSDSLQMFPPDELMDDANRETVKAEGLAVLMSAVEEAKRRKEMRDLNYINKPRQ